MKSFCEIGNYKTYDGQAEDLHFHYNANSGGGQSFLGGKFSDGTGAIVASSALDGRTGVFQIEYSNDKAENCAVLLDDEKVKYEIKPRSTGNNNVKLSVLNKETPSSAIAAFLMMPETCGVNKVENIEAPLFSRRNYWLQSMWLSVDITIAGMAIFTPRDCVFGTGVDKNGVGAPKYYKLDFGKRIRDVLWLHEHCTFEDGIQSCLDYFSAVYRGQAKFDYAVAKDEIEKLMTFLSGRYPTRHSSDCDPLIVIKEIIMNWQKIVYGAPGTGKSFGIAAKVPDEDVFRTTFHPDSDYSTFVGAYKPTMKAEKITYAFRPQVFMKAYARAWQLMKSPAADGSVNPVVLVIEEINRGNCAQIFGDLFQLLDRDDNGWSTYPIDADADLAKWLASDVRDEDQQLVGFGPDGLGLAKPTDATFKMKQSDWDAVMKGKKLALPPNLYIWATMNTSDQSLFPIDSAFKRRWDWKYVPIAKPDKTGDANWKERKIVANGKLYDWWAFITSINAQIADITKSEDKQLGYFFVKAPDATGQITAEQFANKVLFYLFNDVFRDWDLPVAIFGKGTGKDKYAFKDFFYAEKTGNFKPGDVRDDVVAAFIEKQKNENGQPLAGVELTPPAGTPPPAPAPSTAAST